MNALYNFLFISCLEEIFFAVFTLAMTNRFKLEWKSIKIFISVVIAAGLSTVLRYTNCDPIALMIVPPAVMYMIIVISFNIVSFRERLKVFSMFSLALVIYQIIELSYMPLVFLSTGLSYEYFNANAFYSFLLALPERIIEYSLLIYVIQKKISIEKVYVFREIFRSKKLAVVFSIDVAANFIWLMLVLFIVGFQNQILNFSTFTQIVIILGNIIMAVSNIILFLVGVFILKKKYIRNDSLKSKRVNLISDIYTREQNTDRIELIEDIKKCLREEGED